MACPMVGQQVDLTLPLLLLQPEFSSSMAEGATAAKKDEDSPEKPEPPKLIVVGAAASLPTAVTTLTEVGLVVHPWAQLSKQMGLLWMIKDGIQGASLDSRSPNCSLRRRRCWILLLRHPKCPPGLLAAVPAAGLSHASTYSPLKATTSSTASHPAPAISAATAIVPARPIFTAATITPPSELPSGESTAY